MDIVRTMESWPKKIVSKDELPEFFKDSFKSTISKTDIFPYTIYIPPNPFKPRKSSPKLICILNGEVYVWERLRKEVIYTYYSFKNITYIETGSILLNSWLTIHGIFGDEPTSTSIDFNTTRKDLFIPIIKDIRSSINKFEYSNMDHEIAKLQHLKTINLKFLNYAKRSIMQGEQISNIVYQPEVWTKFLKHFNKRLTHSHITILTDNELIIIKEYNNLKNSKNCSYGGVWNYIPIYKIHSISLSATENDDIVNLIIEFKNGRNITHRFSISNRSNLDVLVKDFYRLVKQYSA